MIRTTAQGVGNDTSHIHELNILPEGSVAMSESSSKLRGAAAEDRDGKAHDHTDGNAQG